MLKVGLIGCGFMGTMHANCYKNIEGVELVALADVRKEKAEELAVGTNATIYADGKDLIANADVDVIDICLPTYMHKDFAVLAMEKVKHVFVEKPVALTKKEGKELIKKQKDDVSLDELSDHFSSESKKKATLVIDTAFGKKVFYLNDIRSILLEDNEGNKKDITDEVIGGTK